MKRGLHIAYVCADRGVAVGGCNGAATHVAELTAALAERGALVQLLVARTASPEGGRRGRIPVVDLRAERTTRAVRRILFSGATRRHAQAGAAEAYSLVLNHNLGRQLERLHRRWRVDAVYERYSLWSFAAAVFARTAGVPYLLEVNAPLREEQRRYRILENTAAAAGLETYLFHVADHVVVPSEELRPYVISHGARCGGVRVVPNAADPRRYRAAVHRPPERGGDFVIGFLGTLKPWHGLVDLVRAFRRLHRRGAGYHLLIAGDGPLRSVIERTLRKNGLRDRVTFSGAVDHERVPELLARMHVGVAPYPPIRGFYFSPLKVFDYLAAGLPIVASDIGQVGQVLRHRETALLHRPGRILEMVARIEQVRHSPSLAGRLARNARRAARRYTWQRNAERILTLIERARGVASSPPRA